MKFIKNRPFKARVKVEFPSADPDASEVAEFTGHFVSLPMDELAALPLDTVDQQESYLRRVFVGWDGMTDDTEGKDAPFAFSEENRNLLIRDFHIRRAVMDVYAASLSGMKRGN